MTPRHLPVLQKLLPPTSYDPNGPELVVELVAEANALDAAEDSSNVVLTAFDPEAVPSLLPMWETAYGLPDRCDSSLQPSWAARGAAVKAKQAQQPNFSISYLVQMAALLGYPGATIVQHKPATCASPCNSPLYQDFHRALMDVRVPSARPIRYSTCADPCNLPLYQYDDRRLECAFDELAPAHVLFRFFYGD